MMLASMSYPSPKKVGKTKISRLRMVPPKRILNTGFLTRLKERLTQSLVRTK